MGLRPGSVRRPGLPEATGQCVAEGGQAQGARGRSVPTAPPHGDTCVPDPYLAEAH